MPPIAWIASYPRSGSTWLRLLLANSFAGAPDELHLEALERVPDVITVLNSGRIFPAADRARPAVLRTPFPPQSDVMQLYRAATRKVVYLVRDPRDVLLSSVPHLGIAPPHAADFAKRFISNRGAPQWTAGWGTWLSSVMDWTEDGSPGRHFPGAELLVVRYETLRADPAATLTRVLEFLDAGPVTADHVRRAVDFAALEHGPAGRDGQHQSLAALGEDVEAAYLRAVAQDAQFADRLHRHGYELSVAAGRP